MSTSVDASKKKVPMGPVRTSKTVPKAPRVSVPSVAVSSTNLFVAYALERDKQRSVQRMRIALTSPDLTTGGLTEKTGKPELSDTVAVNEDKIGGDYPSIACTKDACFLVAQSAHDGIARALRPAHTRYDGDIAYAVATPVIAANALSNISEPRTSTI